MLATTEPITPKDGLTSLISCSGKDLNIADWSRLFRARTRLASHRERDSLASPGLKSQFW